MVNYTRVLWPHIRPLLNHLGAIWGQPGRHRVGHDSYEEEWPSRDPYGAHNVAIVALWRFQEALVIQPAGASCAGAHAGELPEYFKKCVRNMYE